MLRQAQLIYCVLLQGTCFDLSTGHLWGFFFPRVINKTYISFSNEEMGLLNQGLKYNLEHKHKQWINNLALGAENLVTLLPPDKQEYTRYQIAKNIKNS